MQREAEEDGRGMAAVKQDHCLHCQHEMLPGCSCSLDIGLQLTKVSTAVHKLYSNLPEALNPRCSEKVETPWSCFP